MTVVKPRHPISWAGAATKIMGALGLGAAAAIGKSDALIRRFADPDLDDEPKLTQALALDAAFVAATGESAPFLRVYETRLRAMTASIAHDPVAPATRFLDVTSEIGDVSTLLSTALRDGRLTHAERTALQKEIADAVEKLSALARDLDAHRDDAGRA
ncbi:MAG: hypothetical protein NBV67_00290 [Tagaea sp.]|nr:hypothetical protein [Tagaea sp.]